MTDHRWWKFRFTASQSGTNVGFATLSARQASGGPNLILPFASPLAPYITSPNVQGGFSLDALADSDFSTGWASGNVLPTEIVVRLQQPGWIGEFSISSFSQSFWTVAPKDFTLSWSDDGVTYTVENTFTGIVWSGASQTQTFVGTAWTPPPNEAEAGLVALEMLDGGGSASKASVALVGLEMIDGAGSASRVTVALVSLETIIGPPVTQAWIAFAGLEVIIGPSVNRRKIGRVQVI